MASVGSNPRTQPVPPPDLFHPGLEGRSASLSKNPMLRSFVCPANQGTGLRYRHHRHRQAGTHPRDEVPETHGTHLCIFSSHEMPKRGWGKWKGERAVPPCARVQRPVGHRGRPICGLLVTGKTAAYPYVSDQPIFIGRVVWHRPLCANLLAVDWAGCGCMCV